MTEERFKMKTELELLREELGSVALKIEALEAKKEKWSPKGGGWYLSGESIIIEASSTIDCKNFGTERDTEAECEDLRKKQEWLNLTHAYACESDGVQEFFYGSENWCVINVQGSSIATFYNSTFSPEKVYMTKKDATELARICREDLINFQFQGGE